MPGYYDWKLRNCQAGATAKSELLRDTIESVDVYLHEMWEAGEGKFPDRVDALLSSVVEKIDLAEDSLEKAKLELATLFPGHPSRSD